MKKTDFHGCLACGAPLSPVGAGRPRKYCDAACAREFWRVARRSEPLPARVCANCGSDFTPWRVDQRFCNDACGHSFHRRKSDQPWNDRRRANYQRRRAAKRSAEVGAPISLAAIRERDGNRCKICGGRVTQAAWPHPQSASLDHIVPLSKGGAHVPANVQLAHLGCNIRKGNRGGGEQLMLYG